MLNITNIPAPRVNIIDERTGLISREWYRFFLNLFTLVGQGNNQTSLDDLQVGPPAQQINVLVSGGGSDVAPPPTPPVSVADYQALLPPTIMAAIADYAALMPPVLPQTTDGTVTSVDVSGGTTGMSFSGGPITTSGTMTMAGTLGTGNGGTGATSLTGAGIVTTTDTQTISGQKNFTSYTNTFRGTTYATSDGGSGSNAYFSEDSGYAVLGGANGVVLASGSSFPGSQLYAADTNTWRPATDNTRALGTGLYRYSVVYAGTGTINTSDATEKQQVRELSESEMRVAQRVKKLIRAFKWNDAVAAKGDGARIHVGVIAQDVQAAFAAEGLDASQYGLFCSDTWTTLDGTSQTRLGVRYDELLAFVIAAL